MKTKLSHWITVALLALTGLALTACNTSRGVGEDLEEAGEEIQEEAND